MSEDPNQQINKAMKVLTSIAVYALYSKSMSVIYDRQYRRVIRSKW